MDHTNYDCIVIVILTHGEHGRIFCKDSSYSLQFITNHFTDKACPTLANKPRIFFIQACRGDQLDAGFVWKYSNDPLGAQKRKKINHYEALDTYPYNKQIIENFDEEMVHNQPCHQDFLIVRSTMLDYVSFRNTLHGSWFIQDLCAELKINGNTTDILTLLTYVNKRISERESEPNRHKQTLCISSMLTKQLIFRKKKSE
jgi:Caspase domain